MGWKYSNFTTCEFVEMLQGTLWTPARPPAKRASTLGAAEKSYCWQQLCFFDKQDTTSTYLSSLPTSITHIFTANSCQFNGFAPLKMQSFANKRTLKAQVKHLSPWTSQQNWNLAENWPKQVREKIAELRFSTAEVYITIEWMLMMRYTKNNDNYMMMLWHSITWSRKRLRLDESWLTKKQLHRVHLSKRPSQQESERLAI